MNGKKTFLKCKINQWIFIVTEYKKFIDTVSNSIFFFNSTFQLRNYTCQVWVCY